MAVYLCLIASIYIVFLLTKFISKDQRVSNSYFLNVSFFLIFLLCALRDYSVGRDIMGYIEVYKESSLFDLGDFSWIYMESGYILLMQICSLIGFSSRFFLILIYGLMLYPIYYIIKKYSEDKLLSVIIFICYQFLVFDLSGIRQGLATSICLMSLSYAMTIKKVDWIKFLLIVLLASTIHRSSLIFLFLPFLLKMRYNIKSCAILIGSMVVAPSLSQLILEILNEKDLSRMTYDASVSLGGTLIFLFVIVLFMMYAYKIRPNVFYRGKSYIENRLQLFQYILITMFSITISLLFSGSTLLRSTMFYTIFLVLSIPCTISMFAKSSQLYLKIIFHIVMIIFFYIFCLASNSLDIVPYKFGTDLF